MSFVPDINTLPPVLFQWFEAVFEWLVTAAPVQACQWWRRRLLTPPDVTYWVQGFANGLLEPVIDFLCKKPPRGTITNVCRGQQSMEWAHMPSSQASPMPRVPVYRTSGLATEVPPRWVEMHLGEYTFALSLIWPIID
jgi:hypothetical protein